MVSLVVCAWLSASCVKERRFLVMQELQAGATFTADSGVELVGEVTGDAQFRQILTLFASGNLQATQGTLLSANEHALLEDRVRIPLLDPVLGRLAAIFNGTTRIGTAQRVAMGRALLSARERGADVLLAPRVEIVTRSLYFVIPLGWIYSSGSVEVKAKAARLGEASEAR